MPFLIQQLCPQFMQLAPYKNKPEETFHYSQNQSKLFDSGLVYIPLPDFFSFSPVRILMMTLFIGSFHDLGSASCPLLWQWFLASLLTVIGIYLPRWLYTPFGHGGQIFCQASVLAADPSGQDSHTGIHTSLNTIPYLRLQFTHKRAFPEITNMAVSSHASCY